jgi:hypothetical protein
MSGHYGKNPLDDRDKHLPANPRSILVPIVATLILSAIVAVPAIAQNPEDELGNWLIYNGTVRFSDRWSMFTEAQVRLWEVASHLNETLVRVAGHYDLSPKALVGLGYLRADTWPFVDPTNEGREKIENRIYQQFTIKHDWARSGFEHRYRLEQRWIEEDGKTDRSGRFRYRLQITTPLNVESIRPGAHFINFYDEFFINIGSQRSFDQNRLYAAYGHQFTPLANLQLGMLWQARTSADFFRLQIFYTHNFDLRDSGGDD